MYYLKHEQECFIGYKTRGEDERFISDKARTASSKTIAPVLQRIQRFNFS